MCLIRKEGPLFVSVKLEPKNSPSVTFLGRVRGKKKQTKLLNLVVNKRVSLF